MRRPAFALGLFALLAAAAFILFWGGSETAIDVEAAAAEEQATTSGLPAVPVDREPQRSPAQSATRADPPSPDPRPGDSLIALIRVVDADTGAGVPLAEVAVMAQAFDWNGMTDLERDRMRRFGEDRVGLLTHFGRGERADAEGRLRLTITRILLLACEDEGRYGELTVRGADLESGVEQLLLLKRDTSLRVRVVDAAGTPLPGMALGLQPLWDGPATAAIEQQPQLVFPLAFTDDQGLAILRHLPRWVEHFRSLGAVPDRAGVRLVAPGIRDNSLVIDPLEPPRETVEIEAPATGVVLVRLRELGGGPVGSADDIVLRQPRPEGSDARVPTWIGEPAGEGAARFPYVALGQELEADSSGSFAVEPHRFFGPVNPGQLVEVELRVRANTPELTGYLVDEQLRPLGRTHLRIPFTGENFGTANYLQTTSDDRGRFRYEFSEPMLGERITLLFVQKQVRWQVAPLIGELGRTVQIARGRTDLGMIVMRPAPLLASGRVLIDGEPPGQRPDLQVQELSGEAWIALRGAVVTWGEPGRFEVQGPATATRMRLQPLARDCVPADPVEFERGQRDLLLSLQSGGSLRVELELDDPLHADGLVAELRPELPSPERNRALTWYGRSPAGERTREEMPAVAWRGLVPGEYRLELRAFGLAEPLAELAGLVVPPGGACEDPRLRPLDLRGRLTRITLSVLDPKGQPVRGVGAVWTGEGDGAVAAWVVNGAAALTTAGPADLKVAYRGHPIEEVTGVRGDRTVRLRDLPVLHLALPDVQAPPGTALVLTARPAGLPVDDIEVRFIDQRRKLGPYTRPLVTRVPLDAERVVELPLRLEEELDLEVWLERNGKEVQVNGCSPARVRHDTAGAGPIPLRIPRGGIVGALEELNR